MAGEVYIADKQTLDNVKNDTSYIREQFPLDISGGTDWSKYIPFYRDTNKEEVYNSGGEGIYIYNINDTLLSITGHGYITNIFMKVSLGSSTCITLNEEFYLRCILDGKALFEITAPIGMNATADTTIDTKIGNCTNINIPYKVELEKNKICSLILHSPLFFKESLEIVCKLNGKADKRYNSSARFDIKVGGGVKA